MKNISRALSVLVVGGLSTRGGMMARTLHAQGVRVLLADRDASLGRSLQAELGERAWFRQTEVANTFDLDGLFAWAQHEVGTIDLLLYSPEFPVSESPIDLDDTSFDQAMRWTVRGFWLCTQRLARMPRPSTRPCLALVLSSPPTEPLSDDNWLHPFLHAALFAWVESCRSTLEQLGIELRLSDGDGDLTALTQALAQVDHA